MADDLRAKAHDPDAQHGLLAPLHALILTSLARLLDRLVAMIRLWQAGLLPPPTPRRRAARPAAPQQGARRSRARTRMHHAPPPGPPPPGPGLSGLTPRGAHARARFATPRRAPRAPLPRAEPIPNHARAPPPRAKMPEIPRHRRTP